MAGMRSFDNIPKDLLGSGMTGMRKRSFLQFPSAAPHSVSFNETESK
jgi:hypothetical protein